MNTCFECGSSKRLNNHHVVPKTLGGTKTIQLCEKCHGLVHGRTFDTTFLTKIAMSKKRKQNYIISGYIPFGYKKSVCGKKLTKIPAQQKIIKYIVKMRKNKETLTAIANMMKRNKVKTALGGKWAANTVLGIIKRYEKITIYESR
jgi:hypothetical protein